MNRKITRIAFLQDYTGFPDGLLPLLDEVAAKGYRIVGTSSGHGELGGDLARFCKKAASLGLGVCLFSSYTKMQWAYLAEHPDQRMMPMPKSGTFEKMLGGPEGCPFNADFKARYLKLLRDLAELPGVVGLWVNDEASMPMREGCYCPVCRKAYREEFGAEMPIKANPDATAWKDPHWRSFLEWRIRRWNALHDEMCRFVHSINPKVKVLFQAGAWEVDLRRNPWYHVVDLSSMSELLDGVSADPYHTFGNHPFTPREVYLSEWCRFLAGIVPEGKIAQVVPQGFSHPTFTRPLGPQDGYWTALVPPACGVDMIAPYTYTLQRCSPVLKTYEKCLRLDKYFERTRPLKYAALVHGAQTEIYVRPVPVSVPDSYDGTRLMPLAESLRNRGTPYAFTADRRLHPDAIAPFKTLVLPEIAALADEQMDAVRRYIANGGNAVILGQLGATDETGGPRPISLLEELTGIAIEGDSGESRDFAFDPAHPTAVGLQSVDPQVAERYLGGAWKPCWRLAYCLDARVPGGAKVLGQFAGGAASGRPAIVRCPGRGNIVWWAGFPTRTALNSAFGADSRNMAYLLFAALVEWSAGGPPLLRVENWPPETPMKQLRPMDPRFMSSFEFFPLVGQDSALGLVTSYFAEPASFPMVLDVPEGKTVTAVTELIGGRDVPFTATGRRCSIQLEMGFDTPALLFHFALK